MKHAISFVCAFSRYLKVNALIAPKIFWIYLHELTHNERGRLVRY